jgi:diguanylate cyclase (GGDEF)-like protein/PAS domain S-box-containing protein
MVPKFFTSNFIVATAYYVGGYAGLLLAIPPGNAAAVWPAAGIALSAILICGNRILPGILLGSILVQTTSYLDASSTEKIISSILIGTVISVGVVCQAWIGAKFVHRIIEHDEALLKERSILLFCLLAGPVACVISASVGILTLWFQGILTVTDLSLAWSTWWIGDSIGVLVFTPIVLCFFGKPRDMWRQRITNVALPLCILSSIAFIIFKLSYQQEMQYLEEDFETNTIRFTNELKKSINTHLNTAIVLKEFFDSSIEVTSEEFSRFVQPKLSRYPEIKALEWIPLVLHIDRGSFEDRLGTQIKIPNQQEEMESSPVLEFYYPIQYLEPYTGNENALGFDIRNNPLARKAAETACVSGKVAVTDAIKLVQETKEQLGIVYYAPVYKKIMSVESNDDCENLSGFTASVFRLENEIINIHKRLPELKLSVSIKNNSHLFYSDPQEIDKSHNIPKQFIYKFEREYVFPVANQQWKIMFSPAAGFISLYSSWAIWLIIVGGLLISGISGVGLLMLTGRALQTEDKIKLRTEELNNEIKERKLAEETLRESNERFRAAYEEAAIGMGMVSLDHKIIEANLAFHNMLGYSNDELIGVNFKDITHPDDVETSINQHHNLITGKIANYHFEKRYIHKQGHVLWVLLSVSLVRDKDATPIYAIAQMQDITERKQVEEKLSYQAAHDVLTGLVNRREFERRAERILDTIRRDKDEHALCFMDLDQFKVVNDTCGHMAGDEMLRQITSVLHDTVRKRDTLARLGGDEFGVLMEHCSLDDAHRVAASLQKAIQDYQFSWEGQTFKAGVSIGLVPITETTSNLTQLLKDADAACYMAKELGRNRIHVYHHEDENLVRRSGEMQWVTRLNQAFEEDRFCLYAQAIVPLGASTDKHYELLIRMKDEQGGIIPPGAFLPAAERYNLISKIDHWVIEHTFGLLADNPAFLSQIDFCSINLSGQSLTSPEILEYIITQLDRTGIQGEKICIEITETAAISNLSLAMKFISTLKGLECRFALDDFGSGLSSFAYLKNLPVDYLKIDGMFVKDIVDDPIDHAMVRSINEIGHVMGMQTIAEFVENDVIKGMLKEIGVNYAQGYGIGRPQPFHDLLKT